MTDPSKIKINGYWYLNRKDGTSRTQKYSDSTIKDILNNCKSCKDDSKFAKKYEMTTVYVKMIRLRQTNRARKLDLIK